MTALSALNTIHKTGLFGNYQNKEKIELTTVSEVKDIQIIQIVHYSKSTVKISSINLDNLKFPEETMHVNSNNETRILWNGPNNWFVVSNNKENLNNIKKKCDDKNFAVTDLSHSRTVIELKGNNVKEILKINAKGEKIESLEQYTIYETSSDVNFENVVGQDSLTRFDNKKKNRNKRKIWKKT